MDWQLTEEEIAIRDVAQRFAREAIEPFAAQWDADAYFPIDTLRQAAKLGFGALYVKSDVQGSGLSRFSGALIFSELAQACVSTAAYLSVHNMVAWIIDRYASDSLRKTWLPALATMDVLGCYCLTEPQSGSDAAALKTTAIRNGDDYVINGSKAFISGGSIGDVYLCMVRTGDAGPKGISCLLIPKDTAGLRFGPPEKKLGWRNQPTTMVFFEECRVPVNHRIGEEGEGFKIALSALNGGRVNIAACSIGGATRCLNEAKQYLQTREQFGKKLQDMQALQFRLADAYTQLDAAKLLIARAARALDSGDSEAAVQCAMAKRFATDAGFAIANEAMQFFGGYGYLQDYPIERFFRDLRVNSILEGTNEVMRLIMARHFLASSA